MPQVLEQMVKAIERSGKSKASAYAIATARLQRSGVLKKGSQQLTKKRRPKSRK